MIGPTLRFKVLTRDGFRCRYCGVGPDKAELEIDHVLPRSKGGTNAIDNLVTSCWECNHGKRDRAVGPRLRRRRMLTPETRSELEEIHREYMRATWEKVSRTLSDKAGHHTPQGPIQDCTTPDCRQVVAIVRAGVVLGHHEWPRVLFDMYRFAHWDQGMARRIIREFKENPPEGFDRMPELLAMAREQMAV